MRSEDRRVLPEVGGGTVKADAVVPEEEFVIDVRNVGKAYHIWNSPTARLGALGLKAVGRLLPGNSRLGRRLNVAERSRYRNFTALEDVSFRVRRGEAIGIIGRNGSGKSTLLQIIVGTLKPTQGEVSVRGRVAALLELGSAFLPDYTGRENVYLNGAVLGFDRERMDALFDGIAAFADIGDFIDQPVKIYSSGMMLRLAFSVQIAVQPDLLVVDEALAVGDAFFQAKCFRRIRRMIDDGVTLLFVSHAGSAIRELCSRAIFLNEGRLLMDEGPAAVLDRYFQLAVAVNGGVQPNQVDSERTSNGGATESSDTDNTDTLAVEDHGLDIRHLGVASLMPARDDGQLRFEKLASAERVNNGSARLLNVQMFDNTRRLRDNYAYGERVCLRLLFETSETLDDLSIGYQVRTPSGVSLVHCDTRYYPKYASGYKAGVTYVLDWHFELRLQHGHYHLRVFITRPPQSDGEDWEFMDIVPHAFDFEIAPRGEGMLGGLTTWSNELELSRLIDE